MPCHSHICNTFCKTDCLLRNIKICDELETIYGGDELLSRFFEGVHDEASAIAIGRGLHFVSFCWSRGPLFGPLGNANRMDEEIKKLSLRVSISPNQECLWEEPEFPIPRKTEYTEEEEEKSEIILFGRNLEPCCRACFYHLSERLTCPDSCIFRFAFPNWSSPTVFRMISKHFRQKDMVTNIITKARAISADSSIQVVVDSLMWEAKFWHRYRLLGGPLIEFNSKSKKLCALRHAEASAGTAGRHHTSGTAAAEEARHHAESRDRATNDANYHAAMSLSLAEEVRKLTEEMRKHDVACESAREEARKHDRASQDASAAAAAKEARERKSSEDARTRAAAAKETRERETRERKASQDARTGAAAAKEAREKEDREREAARERKEAQEGAEKEATAAMTEDQETELGEKIDEWSEGKDLKALLSTLQSVIWPGCWEPVSLTETSTHAYVKQAYRKALRVLHPDKLHSVTLKQNFIANKVVRVIIKAHEQELGPK